MNTLSPILFIAVAIALAILLCITFFINNGTRFERTAIFVAGFAIGMLTLYIKVRLLGF
jgi:high-affinity Fe2+/Pb2+ permease